MTDPTLHHEIYIDANDGKVLNFIVDGGYFFDFRYPAYIDFLNAAFQHLDTDTYYEWPDPELEAKLDKAPAKPEMLNDEALEKLSKANFTSTFIEMADGKKKVLDVRLLGNLIKALGPIEAVRTGAMDAFDYRFHFNIDGAKNDFPISVSVSGDQLHFSYAHFIYLGGDPKRFREVLSNSR